MLGTHTVVLTKSHQTRRQIARTLTSAGIDVDFADTGEALLAAIAVRASELVLIDCDENEAVSITNTVSAIREMRDAPAVILLSMGENKTRLLEMIRQYDLNNLVAKHGAIRATYPILDEHELLVTCEKVLRRDIFGIDKYVGLWGVVIHSSLVTCTQSAHRVLQQFRSYLDRLDLPQIVIPSVIAVAEELISNAMIHAPVDAGGNPQYEHLPRSGDLRLKPGETVNVTYGCDGKSLMLSVSDNFGRLSKETLYRYLSGAFENKLLSPEEKPSGAGLGLSLSFHSIHQLIFNIQEYRRTEAIAGWYLRHNAIKDFRLVEKSLNIFWLPQDSEPASVCLMPADDDRELGTARTAAWASFEKPADNSAIVMRGRVDGETDFSAAFDAKVIDMREVTSFNSPGVLAWQKFIRTMRGKGLVLRGCPPVLVSQVTMIAGLLEDVQVETVLAPFACRSCGLEQNLEMGVKEVLQSHDLQCKTCGGGLEFTQLIEAYEILLEFAQPDRDRAPHLDRGPQRESVAQPRAQVPADRLRPASSKSWWRRPMHIIAVIVAVGFAVGTTIYLLSAS